MQDDIDQALSRRLRGEREARGWSLAGLARHSGVSKAMLSRIERGECSPTASLLGRLSAAFGLTMSEIFRPPGAAEGQVARRAAQPSWRDPATGFVRRSLTPPGGSLTPLELVLGELPPGAAITYPAASYVFTDDHQIVVLEGELTFREGAATTVLAAGDCLRLGAPAACEYANRGAVPCRYVVAVLRRARGP
ncbi:MAG TPA: XRE family transcriptional regulator [Stellaceae bacterium]|nr:XRE family transcriptional regulator [Stellaceae bacterium]